MKEKETLFDTNQLAEFLGINPKSLRELIYQKSPNVPPFVMIGKRRRWIKSSVIKWLQETETTIN